MFGYVSEKYVFLFIALKNENENENEKTSTETFPKTLGNKTKYHRQRFGEYVTFIVVYLKLQEPHQPPNLSSLNRHGPWD